MPCNSCEMLTINGIACHEQGCPESWKDEVRECFECGYHFKPSEKFQNVCDSCISALREDDVC